MLARLRDRDRGQAYHEEFCLVAQEMADLANKYFPDSQSRPYKNRSLPEFSKLSLSKKEQTLQHSRHYLQIWQTLEKENYDLTNERQFLWRALKDFGFWLGADGMDLLRKNEIVELYGLDGTHLWFNMRYMDICSHTMDQIWSQPWSARYKRSPEIDEACHREVEKALKVTQPQILNCSVPEHIVEEVNSTLLLRIKINFQRVAPVYRLQSKEKVGFIVTSKCDVIEAKKEFDLINHLDKHGLRKREKLNLI